MTGPPKDKLHRSNPDKNTPLINLYFCNYENTHEKIHNDQKSNHIR